MSGFQTNIRYVYPDPETAFTQYEGDVDVTPKMSGTADAALWLSSLGLNAMAALAVATMVPAAAAAAAGAASVVVPAVAASVVIPSAASAAAGGGVTMNTMAMIVAAIINSNITYHGLLEVAKRYATELTGQKMVTRAGLTKTIATVFELFGPALVALYAKTYAAVNSINKTPVSNAIATALATGVSPVVSSIADEFRASVLGWTDVTGKARRGPISSDDIALYMIHLGGGTAIFQAMVTPNKVMMYAQLGKEAAASVHRVVVPRNACLVSKSEIHYLDILFKVKDKTIQGEADSLKMVKDKTIQSEANNLKRVTNFAILSTFGTIVAAGFNSFANIQTNGLVGLAVDAAVKIPTVVTAISPIHKTNAILKARPITNWKP
jgi:hypothetical protein